MFQKNSILTNVSDITLIEKHTRNKNANVSNCLWWKTPKGKDIVLVSTNNGEIILIDLGNGNEYTVNLGKNIQIQNIELITTSTSVSLLINSSQGYYQLLLAHQIKSNNNQNEFTWGSILAFKSLLTNNLQEQKKNQMDLPPPIFQPKPLSSTFQPNLKLSIQKPEKNGEIKDLLGVYNPTNNKFEVFDSNLNLSKYALYAYQLFPGVRMIMLTDKLMFVIDKDNNISVLSNLFSGNFLESVFFFFLK